MELSLLRMKGKGGFMKGDRDEEYGRRTASVRTRGRREARDW